MLKFGQALKIVLGDTKPMGWEWVSLSRAHRRVLAEDVIAQNNIPYTDNSAMDGYAVNTGDLKSALQELPVVGVVACGKSVNKRLKRGEAMAIMTGAPIPAGCNAVVPVEDTEAVSSGIVRILGKIEPGKNVRYSGEDVRKGEVVLNRGTAVGAAELGMLASVGRKRARVFQKPVVAILITGNEIIEPGERLRPGNVRDINTFSLCGLVEKFGGVPLPLGIAGDKKVKLLRKMRKGLNSDVMITSGGVSMGKFDFVRAVLSSLRYRERFWKVAMKPGMPISFGHIGRMPVFGLPGNPVSSMVSFLEFVRPLMMKLVDRAIDLPEISALLKTPIVKKDNKRHFLRVKLDYRNHRYFASLTGSQGSGILKSMIECDGIAVIPENAKSLKVGDRVTVQLVV
jgi:molybdopterin molybdotransferase